MQRFLLKICHFGIWALVVLLLCEGIYFYSGQFENKVNGKEVYWALRQSKTKQKKKKVIIGDSVGMQLFPCYGQYDSIASLACNQAVSMAGFYFLLHNYLETNAENPPSEVILLFNPFSLDNNLDRFAFQYFLKPFHRPDYFPFYEDCLLERCHIIPFYWFANVPFVRSSSYSVSYTMPKGTYTLASPIAQEYLNKITTLCSEKHIAFRIVPVPVRENRRTDLEDRYRRCAENNELPADILQALKAKTVYYPNDWYRDHVHFTNQALQTIDRQQLIAR